MQNARVTAFSVSELSRGNQQGWGSKITPSRLGVRDKSEKYIAESEKHFKNAKWCRVKKNEWIKNAGRIFEPKYPKSLHDWQNYYPLAREIIVIEKDMLSDHCSKIMNKFNAAVRKIEKLVANLNDKNLDLELELEKNI